MKAKNPFNEVPSNEGENKQNNSNQLNSIKMKTNQFFAFLISFFNTLTNNIMKQNMNSVDTKSTRNINYRAIVPVLVVVFAVAFSAFTNSYQSKADPSHLCFEINVDNPDNTQATDPLNYSTGKAEVDLSCEGDAQTLCGICFDPNYFPLNPLTGKPDFSSNYDLEQIIMNNKVSTGVLTKTIIVPGTIPQQTVVLHFREEQLIK